TSNFEAAVLYFQSEAADGEERRALLEDAMDKSRGGGITFHGPAILGALALTTTNIGKRKALWAEAEAVLAAGCVGHNYFWFYRHAIDGALDHEDWEAALRFGDALEESVAREPVAWSHYYVEYARALVAAGRGAQGEAIEKRLHALYEQATTAGLVSAAQRAAKSLSNQKPHFSTKHQ
ncbi:MAG: hypothetical protein U9Q71_07165, partial [Pseudomonadota bacterium]|nr:hypothetical protein [Pseudomonadota bacterium]